MINKLILHKIRKHLNILRIIIINIHTFNEEDKYDTGER